MKRSANHANRLRLLPRKVPAGAKSAQLPVAGQGTASVLVTSPPQDFSILFAPAEVPAPALYVAIQQDLVAFGYLDADGQSHQLASEAAPGIGLNPAGQLQPYWVSLDTNNCRVRYGKGEMLRALMLLEYSWVNAPLPFLTTGLTQVQVAPIEGLAIELLSIPVNLDPSPTLVGTDAVTLETLSANVSTVITDLPDACQHLYATVAGQGMTIKPPDFPDFPIAIQYSIVTPGCICYERLQQKDPAFGYLRVTIDGNLGDSPGQPYVLEIWPAGNGSPIHDHGNACAIIKVLWGTIQVSLFAALSPSLETPWGQSNFIEGDVTFLTPDYYQIHQLHNPLPKGGQFCATIQSYRYLDSDQAHYEYFDYIENGQIKQFTPDSDWTYTDFKLLIQEEWCALQKPRIGQGGEKGVDKQP